MTLKSGLHSGLLDGLKTSVLTKWGGADQSINTILTAADPMQALIDAMSFGTKPDFMWGGNEASGATEIGASGFDLNPTGVTQEQTSAVLGSGNFTVFDAATETMRCDTADTGLRVGTGSFAAVWVGNIVDTAGNHLIGDTEGVTGWRILQLSGTSIALYLQSASGLNTAVVTATVPTAQGEVMLCVKDSTALDSHLFTSVGDATNGAIYDETLDNAGPYVSVGDQVTGNGANMEFGIFAMWKGAVAESLTTTHRSNLATFLSF